MSKQSFEEQLKTLGLEINDLQKQQFATYYEMLVEWNKVMNLTGITERSEVEEKHFTDSLSITESLDLNSVRTLIDIGTGAGFPGIPLKIMFPHLHIVLLDSLNKRIKFLNAVIEKLGLEHIKTIHGRAEDFARQEEYREQFDLCVSRAVANLSTLSEYCIPYIRVGGIFVSYKSGEIEKELQCSKHALEILGGDLEETYKFYLPGTEIGRSLVKIVKNKSTKKKYPRKAGMPAKEPL